MSITQRLKHLTANSLWNDLSYEEQKKYLKQHPTSKRRMNKMSPEQVTQHNSIIRKTYLGYHNSRKGTKFKDFLGRPEVVDDREHHRRASFYTWRANIQHALKTGKKISPKVLDDYKRRHKAYENGAGSAAYMKD